MKLRLKLAPDDPAAHAVVREWLQDKLMAELGERNRNHVSQVARRLLIEAIADKRLLARYDQWLTG